MQGRDLPPHGTCRRTSIGAMPVKHPRPFDRKATPMSVWLQVLYFALILAVIVWLWKKAG